MADERNYYVMCDDKCLFPAMTKEQTIAAIAEATGNTPSNIDDAFITKLKEANANKALTFWVGTAAQYNAIVAAEKVVENCLYIITDDSFGGDIDAAITLLSREVGRISEKVDTVINDGGWRDLKRDGVVIGQYRLIGNIAYFNIQYEPTDFMDYTDFENGEPDEISLPVVLDCPNVEGFYTFPFCFPLSHITLVDGVEECKQIIGEVDSSNGGVMKIRYLAKQGSAGVYGSFCAPYDPNAAVG